MGGNGRAFASAELYLNDPGNRKIWDHGAGDANWGSANNWTTGGNVSATPAAGDCVVFATGAKFVAGQTTAGTSNNDTTNGVSFGPRCLHVYGNGDTPQAGCPAFTTKAIQSNFLTVSQSQ